jgi:formylglycine-generating enzyme required for sulfatase activity
VRERYEQARQLAQNSSRLDTPGWGALQQELRAALVAYIETRLAAYDRGAAVSWASLPGELGLDDTDFRRLRQRAAALPDAGDLVQDADGPALSFLPAELGRSRLERGFALMRNEVSRADYARFANETGRAATRCRNRLSPLQLIDQRDWRDPGFEQAQSHPVVCVSFEDARAYAGWLSRRTGATYRLPTLAEWRHAGQYPPQGAACTIGNVGDRSAERIASAHPCSDGQAHTAPTARYRADRHGLFDLVGNASEWTLACGEAGNPLARLLESETCPRRAAAGTSWRDGSRSPFTTHVQMLEPARGYDDVGFRLLRELGERDAGP